MNKSLVIFLNIFNLLIWTFSAFLLFAKENLIVKTIAKNINITNIVEASSAKTPTIFLKNQTSDKNYQKLYKNFNIDTDLKIYSFNKNSVLYVNPNENIEYNLKIDNSYSLPLKIVLDKQQRKIQVFTFANDQLGIQENLVYQTETVDSDYVVFKNKILDFTKPNQIIQTNLFDIENNSFFKLKEKKQDPELNFQENMSDFCKSNFDSKTDYLQKGSNFLELKTKDYLCTDQEVTLKMENNNFYLLSFEYQNKAGSLPFYRYEYLNFDNKLVREGHKRKVSENQISNLWLKESVFLDTESLENIEGVRIRLISESFEEESINLFRNLKISIFEPESKIELEKIPLDQKIKLKQGLNFINSNFGENILEKMNFSFEQEERNRQIDFCVSDITARNVLDNNYVKEATHGKRAIFLKTKNLGKFDSENRPITNLDCVAKRFDIEDLVPDFATVKIEFDYKSLTKDRNVRYFITFLSNENEVLDVKDNFGNLVLDEFGNIKKVKKMKNIIKTDSFQAENNDWNTFSLEVELDLKNLKYLDVVLFATSEKVPKDEESAVLYDNIKLYVKKDITNYSRLEFKHRNFLDQEENLSETINSVEYKNINYFEHKVVFNGLRKSTLLLFPAEYSSKWKAYLIPKKTNNSLNIENYFLEKKDLQPQASKEEVQKFIDQNKLSIVGSRFISKEIDNSIRNDNLTNPQWLDFKQKKKIDSSLHYKINDYSNLWFIDLEKWCKQEKICHLNTDNSYNLEILIQHDWLYLCRIVFVLSILFFILSNTYFFWKFYKKL